MFPIIIAFFGAGFIVALVLAIVFGCSDTSNHTEKRNTPSRLAPPNQAPKVAEKRGKFGEFLIAENIGQTIPGIQYVINDIIFADSYGNSCQIDHIVIRKNGIWVIETKNYIGTIYGNRESKEWMQSLNYGKETHKLQNPLKQNQSHIEKLKQRINFAVEPFNIVVFINSDISHLEGCRGVCNMEQLKRLLAVSTGIELLPNQMERYYNMLFNLKKNNRISPEQHKENVQRQQQRIANGHCPRCGGRLVDKNGTYGKFRACSNYPKCTFTMNK